MSVAMTLAVLDEVESFEQLCSMLAPLFSRACPAAQGRAAGRIAFHGLTRQRETTWYGGDGSLRPWLVTWRRYA